MTTLRVAPTRHRHTENLSGKRRTQILTKTGTRVEGGIGAKTTITTASESKITEALLNPKTAPHTICGGDHWSALSHV